MNLTFSYFSMTPGSGIPNVCVGLANAASHFDQVQASLLSLVFDRDDVAPEVAVRRIKQHPRGAHLLFTSRWLRPVADRLYKRAVGALRPDWIVVNYFPLDAFALRWREKFGYKVAYYYHNVTDPSLYEGEDRTRREREQAAMLATLAHVDAVFTNSDFTRRRVFDAVARDATVACPAADLDTFKPAAGPRAPVPTLLHVGRLVRHKGAHLLLEAFAKVRERHPEAVLRVVGKADRSDYCARIEQRAREIGNVELLGSVPYSQLPTEYRDAWLFTCASLFEGFGMPFLEAHACGLPCVGLDVCSVPEIVAHDETGLLVPKDDVDALAGAIDELLSDPARRERMSAAAIAKSREFGWEKSARRIVETLGA